MFSIQSAALLLAFVLFWAMVLIVCWEIEKKRPKLGFMIFLVVSSGIVSFFLIRAAGYLSILVRFFMALSGGVVPI